MRPGNGRLRDVRPVSSTRAGEREFREDPIQVKVIDQSASRTRDRKFGTTCDVQGAALAARERRRHPLSIARFLAHSAELWRNP